MRNAKIEELTKILPEKIAINLQAYLNDFKSDKSSK